MQKASILCHRGRVRTRVNSINDHAGKLRLDFHTLWVKPGQPARLIVFPLDTKNKEPTESVSERRNR
jgi:hypothetical protein